MQRAFYRKRSNGRPLSNSFFLICISRPSLIDAPHDNYSKILGIRKKGAKSFILPPFPPLFFDQYIQLLALLTRVCTLCILLILC